MEFNQKLWSLSVASPGGRNGKFRLSRQKIGSGIALLQAL